MESLELQIEQQAKLFAALGDGTRLKLIAGLIDGEQRSITDLAADFQTSRQAVTKHLRLLETNGLVASEKSGRESLYSLKVEPLSEIKEIVESIENQWDQTLSRLKTLVEQE